MPIIVLDDVIMSNKLLSARVSGSSMRANSRLDVGETGHMSINSPWSQSKRTLEIDTVPLTLENWDELAAIFEITLSGTYGFLVENPADCTTTAGAATQEEGYYQLQRRYVHKPSGRYHDRPVTRPRALGFALMVNGVPLAPGAYTLDATKGRLTISGNPDPEALTWSGRFYMPVHFQSDALDWDMVCAGSMDQRLLAGPAVILQEVRE